MNFKYFIFTAITSFMISCATPDYFIIYQMDNDPFYKLSKDGVETFSLVRSSESSDEIMENKLLYIIMLEAQKVGLKMKEDNADISFSINFSKEEYQKTVPTTVVTGYEPPKEGQIVGRVLTGAASKSVNAAKHNLIFNAIQNDKVVWNVKCSDDDWGYEQTAKFLIPSVFRNFGQNGKWIEEGMFDAFISDDGSIDYKIQITNRERR